jgi:hypothetical protein
MKSRNFLHGALAALQITGSAIAGPAAAQTAPRETLPTMADCAQEVGQTPVGDPFFAKSAACLVKASDLPEMDDKGGDPYAAAHAAAQKAGMNEDQIVGFEMSAGHAYTMRLNERTDAARRKLQGALDTWRGKAQNFLDGPK